MENAQLDRICRDVYRKYPEVNGVHPRQRANEAGGTVLIFETHVLTGDGHPMRRIVRATVDAAGRVVKISASKS